MEKLLVEVLNMPSIGPNLVLSNDADPADSWFSVVIATEQHRRVIDKYLELRSSKAEKLADTMSRVGQAPFKEALYASA